MCFYCSCRCSAQCAHTNWLAIHCCDNCLRVSSMKSHFSLKPEHLNVSETFPWYSLDEMDQKKGWQMGRLTMLSHWFHCLMRPTKFWWAPKSNFQKDVDILKKGEDSLPPSVGQLRIWYQHLKRIIGKCRSKTDFIRPSNVNYSVLVVLKYPYDFTIQELWTMYNVGFQPLALLKASFMAPNTVASFKNLPFPRISCCISPPGLKIFIPHLHM